MALGFKLLKKKKQQLKAKKQKKTRTYTIQTQIQKKKKKNSAGSLKKKSFSFGSRFLLNDLILLSCRLLISLLCAKQNFQRNIKKKYFFFLDLKLPVFLYRQFYGKKSVLFDIIFAM